jgi:hypothetical protein
MKANQFLLSVVCVALALTLYSCAPTSSRGWSTSCTDGGWASIPISDKVEYNLLYEDVVSIVVRRFEIEMLTKESGYIRTKWDNRFATDGVSSNSYRTRITIKLSEQRKKIEVKSEAERLEVDNWVQGCDTRVLETMKQDLQGLSGY